jgi:hypothetical protein
VTSISRHVPVRLLPRTSQTYPLTPSNSVASVKGPWSPGLDALRGRQKWPHCTPLNGPGNRLSHDGANLPPWPITFIFFVLPPILLPRSRVYSPRPTSGPFLHILRSSFFRLSCFVDLRRISLYRSLIYRLVRCRPFDRIVVSWP